MKRLIMLAFSGLLVASQLWAGPITAEQAERKAKQFLAAKMGQVELSMAPYGNVASSRALTDSGTPLLYVYNIGQDGGFVILSGDDAAPAVLGYAESGSFCYEQLPANARAWIDGYAEQIASLRAVATDGDGAVELHNAIEPLLKSQWNQEKPYNDLCPAFIDGTPSVTGCVATAMAQILYYYKEKTVRTLQADIPAYQCRTSWTGSGQISVKGYPAGSVIDWDNMIDRYVDAPTPEQTKAVSELMAYCGASVEMDYRNRINGGSSANEIGIPEALKKYFGFSRDATVKYRRDFDPGNWDRLIYRELMNKRPVILSGEDTKGNGHAFICDGYNDEGFYHFNWGWGGLSDGYYLMTNLKPTSQGAGGSSGSAYNENLGAVIGMHPGNGQPYQEVLRLTVTDFSKPATGSLSFVQGANTLIEYAFALQNRTTSTRVFDYSLALYKDGEFYKILTTPTYGTIDKITTKMPYGTRGGNNIWWLQQYGVGTYQLKPVSRVHETEEWLLCEGADQWYVDLTISEDGLSYVLHQFVEPEVELGYDPQPVSEEQKKASLDGLHSNIQDVYVSLASMRDNVAKLKAESPAVASIVASSAENVKSLADSIAKPVVTDSLRLAYAPQLKKLNDDVDKMRTELASINASLSDIEVRMQMVSVEANTLEKELNGTMNQVETDRDLANWELEAKARLNELWLNPAEILDELFEIIDRNKAISSTCNSVDSLCLVLKDDLQKDIKALPDPALTATAAVRFVKPVDVFTLSGRRVRSGARTLEGLPAGVYVVGRQKYIVR